MDLRHLLETTLTGLGYEMVDLELGRGGMIRIFMDSPNGITVDDCVKVSNHLTRMFMVENIDFERLEVSSPGLDRPLTKESDYTRFAGQKVKIKLRVPIDRRKTFAGTLIGLHDGRLNLEVDGAPVEIDLSNIDRARLDPQF
ncbi:ribosome maturation factor RimP [Chitinivorax sp. B]|uniref:ribosome maturation factor RimP n=1 Tax=Chitinivorax sp. B TaxID=2502235 RepID=UPI0010F627E4|nr:ribosome maturation factor RimP [Chitinivorax sp. B]